MLRLSVLALASLAFFTAGPASAMGKYVWSLIAIGPDPSGLRNAMPEQG